MSSNKKKGGGNGVTNGAFSGLASLIKLLPTGTMFAYQFLNPLVIGDGRCETINKTLSAVLIVLCGLACFFDSFTDSYKDGDGITHYGIATFKGMWPNYDPDKNIDLSSYRIRFGDFVHSFFALFVFVAVALLNDDSVECFYPTFEKEKKLLLQILPTIVGAVASVVFLLFPTKRHYIGYSTDSNSTQKPPATTTNSLL